MDITSFCPVLVCSCQLCGVLPRQEVMVHWAVPLPLSKVRKNLKLIRSLRLRLLLPGQGR